MKWPEDTPNPGSLEAVKRGCLCPVHTAAATEGADER